MSLRRFPWKAPRLTDNSFKHFVSSPTPGTPSADAVSERSSDGRPKSIVDMSSAGDDSRRSSALSASTNGQDSSSEHHSHHHHHHRHRQNPEGHDEATASADGQRQNLAPKADTSKQEIIKGPWRLLRLLPRESRGIIGRMLEVNPKRRATLEDMMADPWVSNSPVCSQIEGGQIIRAPGHEHTLEPGGTVQPSES